VDAKGRSEAVLDVVDMILPDFLVQLDVINRPDVVGLRVVEEPGEKGLTYKI